MSPAELRGVAAAPEPRTPYRLLWTAGIAATLLALTAFMLWGVGGAGMLLDMVAALCT